MNYHGLTPMVSGSSRASWRVRFCSLHPRASRSWYSRPKIKMGLKETLGQSVAGFREKAQQSGWSGDLHTIGWEITSRLHSSPKASEKGNGCHDRSGELHQWAIDQAIRGVSGELIYFQMTVVGDYTAEERKKARELFR